MGFLGIRVFCGSTGGEGFLQSQGEGGERVMGRGGDRRQRASGERNTRKRRLNQKEMA